VLVATVACRSAGETEIGEATTGVTGGVDGPATATTARSVGAPPTTVGAHDADEGDDTDEGEPDDTDNAHELLFWTTCDDVVALDDDELDRWHDWGVDGFVCVVQSLRSLGGQTLFTDDPTATLAGSGYDTQRALRDSQIGARARARGMRLYLGFLAVNRSNPRTPLVDWFDDDAWADRVIPEVESLASAARQLGFAGLAIDQELYPQDGGVTTATWAWNYPGNGRSETAVRAQVTRRGAELMRAMVTGFPAVELVIYHLQLPGTWAEAVQRETNDIDDAFDSSVQINLLDGLSGTPGYRAIRLLNATFYKSTQIWNASWDEALRYEYNQLFSLFSRRLSNWALASERLYESPFIWISSGTTAFERARPPEDVALQLDAFSRWGMGGQFANFPFDGLDAFDYTDYIAGMRWASTPRVVSSDQPTVAVTAPAGVGVHRVLGPTVDLAGAAHDEYAVRVVRWENDRGGGGTARMTWIPQRSGVVGADEWVMAWQVVDLPLAPGRNVITVTVESIHERTSTTVVVIEAQPGLRGGPR
jgi:hypothetical protein